MAGHAKSAHELSSEELDAVTGGSVSLLGSAIAKGGQAGGQDGVEGCGQSGPAQQFQQILYQLTQGQG